MPKNYNSGNLKTHNENTIILKIKLFLEYFLFLQIFNDEKFMQIHYVSRVILYL
jgi:hypothetical protein